MPLTTLRQRHSGIARTNISIRRRGGRRRPEGVPGGDHRYKHGQDKYAHLQIFGGWRRDAGALSSGNRDRRSDDSSGDHGHERALYKRCRRFAPGTGQGKHNARHIWRMRRHDRRVLRALPATWQRVSSNETAYAARLRRAGQNLDILSCLRLLSQHSSALAPWSDISGVLDMSRRWTIKATHHRLARTAYAWTCRLRRSPYHAPSVVPAATHRENTTPSGRGSCLTAICFWTRAFAWDKRGGGVSCGWRRISSSRP